MVQAGKALEPDLPDVLHRFVQHIKHLVTAVATDIVNDDAVGIASLFAMHTAGRTGETPVLRARASVPSSSYRRVPEFQLIAAQRPAAIQGPCGHADMRVPDFLCPGLFGSQAQSQPHLLPRRVRPQQSVSGHHYSWQTRQGSSQTRRSN